MKKFYVLWNERESVNKAEPVFYNGSGDWVPLGGAHVYTEEQMTLVSSSVPFIGQFVQLPSK